MNVIQSVTPNEDGSLTIVIFHKVTKDGAEGSTTFTFSDIERVRRSEVNAFVRATVHEAEELGVFSGRLNLSSLSAREGFARSLTKIAQTKISFDFVLSQAIEAVTYYLEKQPQAIWIEEAPAAKGEKWLLDPYILEGSPNILFGKGGGGKTFLALRIMLSLVTGLPILGITPSRTVKCLFLDYEDIAENGMDRIYKLCGGMFKPELDSIYGKIRYFKANGVPLHELIPTLKEEIAKHGIEFILVDSAALACGGEPEKAESAIRFFNALSKLNITSLVIAHETKAETHEYVFGSVFFHNSARNIWNTQAEHDEDDPRIIQMGLFHRKCNHGSLKAPRAVKIFHGEGFVDVSLGDIAAFDKELSVPQRIIRLLRDGGQPTHEINERLGGDKNTIKVTLQRLKKKEKIMENGLGFWSLKI